MRKERKLPRLTHRGTATTARGWIHGGPREHTEDCPKFPVVDQSIGTTRGQEGLKGEREQQNEGGLDRGEHVGVRGWGRWLSARRHTVSKPRFFFCIRWVRGFAENIRFDLLRDKPPWTRQRALECVGVVDRETSTFFGG